MKPFYQINDKLEIVNRFDRVSEAADILNLCKENISACLRQDNKYKTVNNFLFIYCNEINERLAVISKDIQEHFYGKRLRRNIELSKKVRVTNLKTMEIIDFPSAKSASLHLGKDRTYASTYIRKNQILNNTYKFEYI